MIVITTLATNHGRSLILLRSTLQNQARSEKKKKKNFQNFQSDFFEIQTCLFQIMTLSNQSFFTPGNLNEKHQVIQNSWNYKHRILILYS